jgi:hypothetical protein
MHFSRRQQVAWLLRFAQSDITAQNGINNPKIISVDPLESAAKKLT